MTSNKRCNNCKSKLNYIERSSNQCKCGNKYCSRHLTDHECTFDYRKENIDRLEKKLVKTTAQKINKI